MSSTFVAAYLNNSPTFHIELTGSYIVRRIRNLTTVTASLSRPLTGSATADSPRLFPLIHDSPLAIIFVTRYLDAKKHEQHKRHCCIA